MSEQKPSKYLAITNAFLGRFKIALEKGDHQEVKTVIHEILTFKENIEEVDIFNFTCHVFTQALMKEDPEFLKMVWNIPLKGARDAMLVRYFIKKSDPSLILSNFILNQFQPEYWAEFWLSKIKLLSGFNCERSLLGFQRLDSCIALLDEKMQSQYIEEFQKRIVRSDEYIPEELFPETKTILAKQALNKALPDSKTLRKNESRL